MAQKNFSELNKAIKYYTGCYSMLKINNVLNNLESFVYKRGEVFFSLSQLVFFLPKCLFGLGDCMIESLIS